MTQRTHETVYNITKTLALIAQLARACRNTILSIAGMLAATTILIIVTKILLQTASANPEETIEILTKLLRLL